MLPALAVHQPVRFDFQPTAFDHHVGGCVGVWALSERAGEQMGGVRRKRLSKAMAMIEHGFDVLLIEDSRELVSRCFLPSFLTSSYLLRRKVILYVRARDRVTFRHSDIT